MNEKLFIEKATIIWDEIKGDSYLRKIDAFKDIEEFEFNNSVTFFIGENGSGKSTLLEAIAIEYGFNPEGGTKNYSFSTYDSHSELCKAIKLTKGIRQSQWGYFLRAESFYNVATKELEYARSIYESDRYHERSHGESFLKMAQNNFKPNGMYLLDEPEAALSPQRQLTLIAEIHRCVKAGSQFIIATHSPILLGMPDAEILMFDETGINRVAYEDTEIYQITSLFLNRREQMLKELLAD